MRTATCYGCEGWGHTMRPAVCGGPFPVCSVCRGKGTLTPEWHRLFDLLRGWRRERAMASNTMPYLVATDGRLANLAATGDVAAAAWCLVAPCR